MKSGSFFSIILLALINYSCKEKEDIYPDWGTDVECRQGIQILDTVKLSDISRQYVDFMIYQSIVYKNQDGDELRFEKSTTQSPSFFMSQVQEKCKGFIPNIYLIPMESAFCSYVSNRYYLNYLINVSTTDLMNSSSFVDNLNINLYSANYQDTYQFSVYFSTFYRGITEQEYQNINPVFTPYEKIDSIGFNGKTYYNVIKLVTTWQNTKDVYLSKEHGVLAFKDDKNVLWVWNRFIN